MGREELKAFDADIADEEAERKTGRLEIHVKQFMSVNANAPTVSTGVSYFKCAIDRRTKGMLAARIPRRYFGAILPAMRNLAFYIHPAKPQNGTDMWVLTVGSEALNGFTKYVDGHAMFIVELPEEEYSELRNWLDPSTVADGYDVEFDFEPLNNPRSYKCSGSRVAHIMRSR